MPILTLTTDFGDKSFDVAALKGMIMSHSFNTRIVDISHNIGIYDIINAAYSLKNAASYFPPKTIHFTNINLKDGNNKFLIISRNLQYYICPDNGMISIMFPEEDFKAFYLNDLSPDFSYIEIHNKLCEIIKYAEMDSDITKFGDPTNSYLRSPILRPSITPELLKGSIIKIDRYGNGIVNISKEFFYNYVENHAFKVSIRNDFVNKIHKHYSGVDEGAMVCLFNSANLLEIAINKGNAVNLLSAEYGQAVMIEKI